MKYLIPFVVFFVTALSVSAADLGEIKTFLKTMPCVSEKPVFETQDVFTKPEDKKIFFRIPSLVCCPDGTLIASYRDSHTLRRSEDKGKTWLEPFNLDFKGGGSLMVDTTTGDVLIVSVGGGLLMRSKDSGKTWTEEPISVKSNVAGMGGSDARFKFSTHGSESGITLKNGKHKGRLLIPGRIAPSYGKEGQDYWMFHFNTSIFSDDGGKNWQVSHPVQSGTGEATLAELADGTIYFNSRSHLSSDHMRRIAYSYDGGDRYVDWEVADDLREIGEPSYFKHGKKPSYGCCAGLLALPLELTGGKDVLLFSAPDNPGKTRLYMTVWASFDKGKSWPVKRRIFDGGSAYSSLAAGKDGNIYLLFEHGKDEKNPYDAMAVVHFNLAWLFEDLLK